MPLTIARSAPTSTRPANVLANQNQSAMRPALRPIPAPSRPSFEAVDTSSATLLHKSKRTGGDAWRKRCKSVGEVSVALELDVNGMSFDVGDVIWMRGVSQLNMIRHFLDNDSR